MNVGSKLARVGVVVGIVLLAGPLFGVLGSACAMMLAFRNLGNAGITHPRALEMGIGLSLHSAMIGLLLCPLGALLLIVSRVLRNRSAPTNPPPLPPGSVAR